MKSQRLTTFALWMALCLASGIGWSPSQAIGSSTLQPPTLEWQHAGCYDSWCETGWYSSPAVADLDGNGTMEVIAGFYTLFILNGEDGTVRFSLDTPGDRVAPGVVVADIDNDPNHDLEIVFSQNGGYLYVLDHLGNELWSRQPTSNELYSLSVYDLDDDGTMEIVAGASSSPGNTWVYEHNGDLRPGWPQLSGSRGYVAGIWNDNITVGDVDGDSRGEIFVPSDMHYIAAYEENGTQIPVNAMYGDKFWSETGVHVDHWVDLRGYAHCGSEHRSNFMAGASTIVDVNGDGVLEIVSMGNVENCGTTPYTSLYKMVYIFNADRTRWKGDGFDWEVIPVPDGSAGPLSQDWREIRSAKYNPVTADLDGDGYLEILFSSYDGRVHAYWLDKQEHHNWPYDVHTGGPLRFSSEPVVADLDNAGDGHAEVIFSSWTQVGSNQTGKLHILSYQGDVLHEIDLPMAYQGSASWNGALAAPTLANIDDDENLEVVLVTANSGAVAYELPGTEKARVLWGTGRGNYQRTGSIVRGSLSDSRVSVSPAFPNPGDLLAYTIQFENPASILKSARVTSTLPAEVVYQVGSLSVSHGSADQVGGAIFWSGEALTGVPITITYKAIVDVGITQPTAIVHSVLFDDGLGNVHERSAVAIVNGLRTYLPLVFRH